MLGLEFHRGAALPPDRWGRITFPGPNPNRRHVRRLDRLNVVGRIGRWRQAEDSLPQTVETEEKLDFLPAERFSRILHGRVAARAFHGIRSPCLPDQLSQLCRALLVRLRLFWFAAAMGSRTTADGGRGRFCVQAVERPLELVADPRVIQDEAARLWHSCRDACWNTGRSSGGFAVLWAGGEAARRQ